MGYNNHNCGMHFIYHYRDWFPDERRFEDEMSLLRNKKKTDNQKHTSDAGKLTLSGANTVKKQTKYVLKTNDDRGVMKSEQKAKVSEKKTYHEAEHMRTPYGTEKTISRECLETYAALSGTVMSNVMRIAIQKKLDIRHILEECEKIMVNDLRANPSPENRSYGLFNYPKNELSFLSLAVLAEKLGCSVFELFVQDEVRRKNFAYSLLEKIEEILDKHSEEYGKYYYNEFEPDASLEGQISIALDSFDVLSGMTDGLQEVDPHFKYETMRLELMRFEEKPETFWYSIMFGINTLNDYTKVHYYPMYSFLWEERDGKLKDFIEDILEHCPITE